VLEEVLVGGASGLGVPELRPVVEVERARRAGVARGAEQGRRRLRGPLRERGRDPGRVEVLGRLQRPVGSSAGVTVVIAASARS